MGGFRAGCLAVVLALGAGPVWAQTSAAPNIPAPVIMVVDTQAVVSHSKAGLAIRQQHDKYLQDFDKEVQATRRNLSEVEAELTREKTTTPFIDWQKKAQAFDQQLSTFNLKYGKINQSVEKSYISAMNELGKAITQVTSEVANEYGVNLVLPTQQVILHDPRMDLTKTVIERMDIKFPSIAFPAPEVPGGEASNKGPGNTGMK